MTTAAITYITPNTATGGGEITDDGGAEITFRGVCWNTAGEPTISDFMTEDGSGTGSFTSSLTGLNPNTTYYVRAYATTSVGTEYGDQLIFMTLVDPTTTTVDYDGNEFDSVIIGDQEWMAENLKVTHYPDGSDIPHVTGNSTWAALGDNNTSDAYCWYNDDEATNKDKYGALYTYSAAINACPTGWHLPSDAEWTELENYLIANGYNWDGTTSGDKTGKSLATTSGWSSSSEAGDVGNDQSSNNTTGFMALPGGYRYSYNGSFDTAGFSGYWWSSTEVSSTGRALAYNYADLSRNYYYKSSGFSIRCLRD